MTSVPARFQSRTGLAFTIDTNAVDDESSEMVALRSFHDEGWIDLRRTDTVDTELAAAPDDKRDELLEASSEYVEVLGTLVQGHSRLDHAVLGNDEDADRIATVFKTLSPDIDPSTARKQHQRDAMHVTTAIRYGLHGFITNDHRLLGRAAEIQAEFNGFLILSPGDALAITQRQVNKARRREVAKEQKPQ